jgi:hypothetical protein
VLAAVALPFERIRRIDMAKKTTRLSHGVTVSALFSAMSLLYGTAAYGSFYPGHVDPGGNGSDIPGFNGNLIFSIDPNCVTGTGFHATNAGSSNGCGNASVYSADISLYSTLTSDPPHPGTVLDSFQLGTLPDGPSPEFDIFGVQTLNGHVTGVETAEMGPVTTTGFYASDQFWLLLTINPIGDTTGGDPAYLAVNTMQNLSGAGTEVFGPACKTDANGAPINCVVGTVPEPGTLSLILGALGGGWLARRRKQKAAAAS